MKRKNALITAAVFALLAFAVNIVYAETDFRIIEAIDASFAPYRAEIQLRAEYNIPDSSPIERDSAYNHDVLLLVYSVGEMGTRISEDIRVIDGERLMGMLSKKTPSMAVFASYGVTRNIGGIPISIEKGKSGAVMVRHMKSDSQIGALPIADESLLLVKSGYILKITRIEGKR